MPTPTIYFFVLFGEFSQNDCGSSAAPPVGNNQPAGEFSASVCGQFVSAAIEMVKLQ